MFVVIVGNIYHLFLKNGLSMMFLNKLRHRYHLWRFNKCSAYILKFTLSSNRKDRRKMFKESWDHYYRKGDKK